MRCRQPPAPRAVFVYYYIQTRHGEREVGVSESVAAAAGTLGLYERLCEVLCWLPLIASKNTPFLPSSARQYLHSLLHNGLQSPTGQRLLIRANVTLIPSLYHIRQLLIVFTRIKMADADATVNEVENVSYTKLPGAKNARLWNYFAFKSKSGMKASETVK